MISHTEENYLKVLYNLTLINGEATVNEISKELGIKMPTVNSMMKKLAEKGFVIYESYKPLKLTSKGKKEAALIIRKHRLTEMFLVQKMAFGWEEVHKIAEQIEHIQSPDFFNKMDELLGYPKTDPHGSPIPDAQGNLVKEHYLKLIDCKIGDSVTLMAVQQTSEDLLKYLTNLNLTLGTKIKIINIEPFDSSMLINYGAKKTAIISSKVCDKLLVKKSK